MNYLIPFIILITVVVFIHEYGHYYFARRYGVGVTAFSIGFGKEIFGYNDKNGTRWKFCLIPLGGYVKFFGDRNVYSQADQEEILKKYSEEGIDCILIGHSGHQEVEGTIGQYDTSRGGKIYLIESPDDARNLSIESGSGLAYVTQTTLSVDDTAKVIDALKERFPAISGPRKDDICYATQNRQDAVKQLAIETDLILVVGSESSSNSNRLRELAERCGCKAYLIDDASNIRLDWLKDISTIGVTAGASAPETLVNDVITRLVSLGANAPCELRGAEEAISFSLPKELRI